MSSTSTRRRRGSSISTVEITGLQAGELIPRHRLPPGDGSARPRQYKPPILQISLMTGAAAAVGAGPFASAERYGLREFDFNPTVDRIRIVWTPSRTCAPIGHGRDRLYTDTKISTRWETSPPRPARITAGALDDAHDVDSAMT
ncbi:MAG: DUF4394 domain-containing protein [Blastocatellia bacterium]|nr:DUF4394 domain-containing protein [Blastocatellia bacterium]